MRRVALALVATVVLALPAAAQARTLVTMHVSGGLAGVDERLVVRPSGAAKLESSRNGTDRFQVRARRMERLRTALKRARWKTLRHDYRADMPVADGVSYSIRYHGKTVFTEDGADPPKRFERVKAILTRIAEQHR